MKDENIARDASTAQKHAAQQHQPARQRYPGATVILVHGLWTPAAIFALHDHWLQLRGYRVLRFGYPSVRATLSENAQRLSRYIAASSATDIHLVGHSLGGLVILETLAHTPNSRLRRVVLLGTPCIDSHCARRLAGIMGISTVLGRSIMEWLSRGPAVTIAPRPPVEVGVLAGTRSIGLGRVVPGLPQPNDGVVALAETRLPGAADFIALPIAHSEMLASRPCAAQVASFLASGHFRHAQ